MFPSMPLIDNSLTLLQIHKAKFYDSAALDRLEARLVDGENENEICV